MLEKRAHESWVSARQAERKLEDSKQESAQLRNRLTLMSNQINDEKQSKTNSKINPINTILNNILHKFQESSHQWSKTAKFPLHRYT